MYDGVEDGGAECAASGEGETGRGGEESVWGRELDKDNEGEGPDWLTPERMLKPIWAWFMLGVIVQ